MKGTTVTYADTGATKHCVMIYRFGGIRQAYDFQDLLVRLGVPASAKFTDRFGWYVETSTRCLEVATAIAPFIYKAKKGRA